MPSNLTPVVITDKNGRVTTVHRKNAKVGKAKAIPAPKRDYKPEGQKAMLELGIEGTFSKTAVPTLAYLAEHDPKLLSGIIERCAAGGMEEKVWMLRIKYRDLFCSPNPEVLRNNLEECRGLLELYPVASSITQATGEHIPGVIERLVEDTVYDSRRFNGGGWDLVRVSMIAKKFAIDDDEAHDITFTLWKRLPEMIDLIPELAKRGKVDMETFEMLLDSEYPALRDGEL